MRQFLFCLMALAGCSSQGKVEIPRDPKPAPTEVPKVRSAGDGFAVK